MSLVDRSVRIVDDLKEFIEESGGVSLGSSIESVLKNLPACRSLQDSERSRQCAIRDEVIRYRVKVQEPAFAILRKRQARPGSMRKEPVTFTGDTAAYYRKVLDGIDPRLPRLTGAIMNSLTIGISWPPNHPLRTYPPAGFIASCHGYLLALYFGTYRPGLPEPGCYLVINIWANSVAIVPPLPTRFVTTASYAAIGAGVAVLRHNKYGDYVIAELYLHQDSRTHLPSNKATLFFWWSSGPLAGQWMQKEVVLPIPTDQGMTPRIYSSFRADMVFAVSTTSLCWVDLRTGILICDHIDMLATGTTTDVLVFCFIPLPEECAMMSYPISRWRPATEFRTMFCVDHRTIMFVCMDSYTQSCPFHKSVLTTWSLSSPLTDCWHWCKEAKASLSEQSPPRRPPLALTPRLEHLEPL
ncbi:hypothetical protein HU200_048525 [Digitaria exilis]|uniref:DUF1618 domain-containing protein n=1 Tax=Digitaria exilis TaxID=1010633 RepID=A0A835AXM5_9POAL|nr:hypothetical protein HU200_048525 [Digitaria exilis]